MPLFQKLREGRIHKALLIYPTIALMDDQPGDHTGAGKLH
ncbi:MAG: hypothetical protein ACUVWZ_11510 [Anaerolineae bacterium]